MEGPNYTVADLHAGGLPARLVLVEVPGGATTPEAFAASLEGLPCTVSPGCGVILSGRMPIWGAAMLCHHFHPASWVATYDPRLGGGVVVQSHSPSVQVGALLAFDHP